jgi:rhamnopyranosyl-N-acetylglucosaminyl-diphospho-decaprenol beta-1,3/1,4-galactofuranosyltransferase
LRPPRDQSPHGIVAVLVTHNRPLLLAEALEALARQTLPAAQVIVVDNASDRETQRFLDQSSGIRVVRSETNLGGAGGFALGMRRALDLGARWVWLMDDDAIPESTALEALHRHLASGTERVGALCGAVMEFGGIATVHRRRFNGIFGTEHPVPSAAYADEPVRIDIASFVGFLVSAAAVRNVGLPNAAFFLSYDDTEYSLRLRRAGFDLWLVPDSVIVHKRSPHHRLRSTPFGAKHYFNVRNRIVVKRAYCRVGVVGACTGALFGLALWLRSPRCLHRVARATLVRALADGFAGRLGPMPDTLNPVVAHA